MKKFRDLLKSKMGRRLAMEKKIRVRTFCQTCNKVTAHEIRKIDGQENCICLVCEGIQKAAENAAWQDQNRYETQKFEIERQIEAERTRTFSPGG
jgi:hypothetical protein